MDQIVEWARANGLEVRELPYSSDYP